MEVKGKIHLIGATDQVSETFKKRDLIVEVAENPTYPEYIRFEMLQDKTALADNLKVGQEVEVSFNLRGRPWTDKTGKTSYFNSLVIWRITANGQAAAASAPQQEYTPPASVDNYNDDDSDLPF